MDDKAEVQRLVDLLTRIARYAGSSAMAEIVRMCSGDAKPLDALMDEVESLRAALAAKTAECEDAATKLRIERKAHDMTEATLIRDRDENAKLRRFAGAVLRDDDPDNFDEYAIAAGLMERRGQFGNARTPFGAACVAAAESEAPNA